MTVDDGDLEVVRVVNRRMELLEALDEPREKRDLVEELDASRSTVDRALRELESLGLVARGDGYRLTVTGRLVVGLVQGLLADLEDVVAAGELLAALPPDAPMSPALLRGATVEVAEPPSPTRALDLVFELYEGADRVRGLSVATSRPDEVTATIREKVAEGTDFEYVLSAAMVEYVTTTHRETMRSLQEDGGFGMYRHDDLPYGLGLVDGADGRAVFITIYDGDHALQGVVVNDTPAATGWAESVYEHYRAEAEPFAFD